MKPGNKSCAGPNTVELTSRTVIENKLLTSLEDGAHAAILASPQDLKDLIVACQCYLARECAHFDSIGWHPIDSAPTTGREKIWLKVPGREPQKAYSNTWWNAGFSAGGKPTHWYPCDDRLDRIKNLHEGLDQLLHGAFHDQIKSLK